jgi:hypothetical protein
MSKVSETAPAARRTRRGWSRSVALLRIRTGGDEELHRLQVASTSFLTLYRLSNSVDTVHLITHVVHKVVAQLISESIILLWNPNIKEASFDHPYAKPLG